MEFDYRKPKLDVLDLVKTARRREKVDELREYLVREGMHEMYKRLVEKNVIPSNNEELEAIEQKNLAAIESLEAKKNEDIDNENHVFDIDRSISEYYCQTLDVKNSEATTRNIKGRSISTSLHMDIFLCRIRMGMILGERKIVEENITAARDLCEKGCDWDRRNKFKTYEAIYLLRKGVFKKSADLFAESLPTFESAEVCSYEKAVLYTIFAGMLSFDREGLRDKIILSSDVLEVRASVETGFRLVESFYNCDYPSLFPNLVRFLDTIAQETYLAKYTNLFCREVKLGAYRQLLQSYQSLSLESLAGIFGVSSEYVEKDLVNYIVADGLMCKIDKVDMTVFVVKKESDRVGELLVSGDELMKMIKKRLR